jgi:uncharacterized membrane protein
MAISEQAQAERRTALTSPSPRREARGNIGEAERLVSIIGGGALALYGLKRGSLGGVALAIVGGGLIFRGATAHRSINEALGIDTASTAEGGTGHVGQLGIKVEKSITIDRPAAELFAFWRNFENLPKVMSHVESVNVIEPSRSHWVVKAPAGTTVEWDAVIHNEKPNELIAWRSADDAEVLSAGSVNFRSAPDGRGTEVKVSLQYDPPGGVLGALVAKLFGEAPEQQIEQDLRRFKQVMEAGEAAPTKGQPSGRAQQLGQ